jgi:hypothetical protein
MARLYTFTFPSPVPVPSRAPRRFSAAPKRVLKRLLDAIIASRMRQAERELQRLRLHDGPLASEHRAWLGAQRAAREAAPEVWP